MSRLLVRRVFQLLDTLFIVLSLLFLLVRIVGDPVAIRLGTEASAEDIQRVRAKLGFDRPLYVQYGEFIWMKLPRWTDDGFKVLEFDDSLESGNPALPEMFSRLPKSLGLAGLAIAMAAGLSVPLGTLAATRRGTIWGWWVLMIALIGQTVPNFVIGLVFILAVSIALPSVPILGISGWSAIAFPALCLAAFPLARLTRLVKAQMLETLNEDFIRTARAKGLSEKTVIIRHALRNALLPWATMLAIDLAALVGGALIIEQIFLWPGVGSATMDAVFARDYPMVEAGAFLLVMVVVLANTVVDIGYRFLDPRIETT